MRRPPTPITPEREAELVAAHEAAVARHHRRLPAPLTRVLPRPHRVTLGGVECPLSELTLLDLADLQQWLADRAEHPCDSVTATEPAERRRQLLAAWEAAKAYPPRFGSDEARALSASAEWLVRLLWLSLRHATPGITEADALAIGCQMTPADTIRVYRVAYGTDAWSELLRELDPDDTEARPLDWTKAILDLLGQHPGWTFETVGNLTVSQWRALRCGPEAFGYRCRPRPGESLRDARDREQRMLAPGVASAG